MKKNLLTPLKRILKILSKTDSEDTNIVPIVDKIADSLENANINLSNQLPETTVDDDDKILGVIQGKWEKIDPMYYDDKEIVAAKQVVTLTDQIDKAPITLENNIDISSIEDLSDATVIINGRTFKYDDNYNIFYYDYLEKNIIYVVEEHKEDETFVGITFTAYDNDNQIITGDYVVEIVRPKAAESGGGALICTLSTENIGTNPITNQHCRQLDKTYKEIEDALIAGKSIYIIVSSDNSIFYYPLGTLSKQPASDAYITAYGNVDLYQVHWNGLSWNFVPGPGENYPLEDLD